MGLGDMFGKLFKKEGSGSQQHSDVLSPKNALTENREPENIYETATVEEADSKDDNSEDDNDSVSESAQDNSDTAQEPGPESTPKELTPEAVLEVLSEVYDPEIPIDIVNLGLIYGIDIEGSHVHISMTMTAPGCPASTQIAGESKILVEEMQGVESVEIEIVWDPPWDPSKMSEEAQQSLGMF